MVEKKAVERLNNLRALAGKTEDLKKSQTECLLKLFSGLQSPTLLLYGPHILAQNSANSSRTFKTLQVELPLEVTESRQKTISMLRRNCSGFEKALG